MNYQEIDDILDQTTTQIAFLAQAMGDHNNGDFNLDPEGRFGLGNLLTKLYDNLLEVKTTLQDWGQGEGGVP